MTLTELRYIVALAQERHFGRAAERCRVSQPTLSVGIKKLEDELGITIFERSKNVLRLTPPGEAIVLQAQKVLAQAQIIRELAQEGRNPLTVPLRIGAIYTVGPYLFPRLIPQLHQMAPQMPLYIEENFTHVLGDKLRAGELDAIILALPFAEPDILVKPLYDEPFYVLMPADHSWTGQSAITEKQLSDQPLLLLGEGHCFRNQVLEVCPSAIRNPDGTQRMAIESTSLETIRYMVASGLGLSVLPLSAVNPPYASPLLQARPFAPPMPQRKIAVAWRASFPYPTAIEALSQAIQRCAPTIPA